MVGVWWWLFAGAFADSALSCAEQARWVPVPAWGEVNSDSSNCLVLRASLEAADSVWGWGKSLSIGEIAMYRPTVAQRCLDSKYH